MYKTGDILDGKNNFSINGENIHYILYLYDINGRDFYGTVLTHSEYKKQNIAMASSHFQIGWNFKYENTYFIPKKFIKLDAYSPYEKIGELTESGVLFVKSHIDNINDSYAVTWEEYLKSI